MANQLYPHYKKATHMRPLHRAITSCTGNGVTPIVVGIGAGHNILDGEYIGIAGVLGNTAANGDWIAKNPTSTTVELYHLSGPVASVGNGAYTSGGYAYTGVDLLSDTIAAALVNTVAPSASVYTANFSTDIFLGTIVDAGAVIVSGVVLTNKSVAFDVFDADDITFPSVPAGPNIELVVLYKMTGDPYTSQLLAFIDTATNLPITPGGGNAVFEWNNGIYKIFRS